MKIYEIADEQYAVSGDDLYEKVRSSAICSSSSWMETLPASVLPGIRISFLRVSGLFLLIRTRGVSLIDRSQGIVHKLSLNFGIAHGGSLRFLIHRSCPSINWMRRAIVALIKTDL